MSSEWKFEKLGKISINLDSQRIPIKASERIQGPYPYYGASGIVDYVKDYLFEGLHLLVSEDGENLRTRKTPIAFLAEGKFWVNNHAHIITGIPDISDTKYLMYALSCADISGYLSGSTQPKLTQENLNNIKIPFADYQKQKQIANILSSLDDKIELNRQMCKTLEDIASTLFKSWFIDFDPVKEKTAGRNPEGLSPEIAELFPDTFNSNELPNSWHFSVVYDWAEYINGAAYKDSHFSEAINGFPIIKIAELKSGISSGTKYTNVNLGDKYKIETGNILLSWSGSPETSIDTFLWVGGAGWLNQHIFNVIPKTYESRTFVYFLLKYLKPKLINIAKNKQTTGLGHITVKDLKELKVVNPGSKLIKSFDLVASPILKRIQQSMEENIYLSRIRNNLLPKLISGEIQL